MKKTLGKESKFDSILTETIDEALSICGERGKSALYTYLDKALGIPKSEIPTKIDEFSQTLEDLFGVSAHILEILVMKNLHSKIGVTWKWETPNPQDLQNLTFEEYVKFAKRQYNDSATKKEQMGVRIDQHVARGIRK